MAEEEDDGAAPKNRTRRESDESSSDVDVDYLDLVHTQNDAPKSSAATKKDDNPFSFRHFLHSADRSYQQQGARPKVYCEGRPITMPAGATDTAASSTSRIVNEYPSALPDFVQDHLVIEQCYLNKNNSSNYNADQNLPDFALERGIGRGDQYTSRRLPEFPLDLTMSGEHQPPQQPQQPSPPPPVVAEVVGNSKSLPDFLADGAVRTSGVVPADEAGGPSEIERLRTELESARRQLAEQTRFADCLNRELEIARGKEHEYTQNLAKALEQVEENLERSKLRASSSESNIMKLRQEVKALHKEVNHLKNENAVLRSNAGEAAAGACAAEMASAPGMDVIAQRHLAQDLRSAASTAEHSLRQLLSGVENLRLLASRVENLATERRTSYASDGEEDDDPVEDGPAL